jgi:hypothetical protein
VTFLRLTALAACTVLLAVLVAGCGEKAPGVPSRQADTLIRLLRNAREQADDPDKCDELQSTIRSISVRVKRLPDSVDSDVRDSLENGASNLASAARDQCSNADKPRTTPTTETETVPTTPTETTPTETTPTTPTETTPTQPTTPTEPTTPTTPDPGNGGTEPGNGNGNAQTPKPGRGHAEERKPGKGHDKREKRHGHDRGGRA